jgi:formylglycine-generating enzyme required for sulfatase activity
MERELKFMANLLLAAAFAAVFASCSKDDPKSVQATDVMLNKSTLALVVGAYETLTATVSPDHAVDKALTWTSSAQRCRSACRGANYPGNRTINAGFRVVFCP